MAKWSVVIDSKIVAVVDDRNALIAKFFSVKLLSTARLVGNLLLLDHTESMLLNSWLFFVVFSLFALSSQLNSPINPNSFEFYT